MLLLNEQHQQLNIKDVKAELKNLDGIKTPTREEAELALEKYYKQALAIEGDKYHFKAEFVSDSAMPSVLGDILAEIKKIICGVLNGASTTDEIIDAVLSALSGLIPGAIFISTLVKIVVKYILSTGITNFCAV